MSTAFVPSLRVDLMSSTALTPTQHKGGMAKVLGFAAAIAIPWAAPYIATSIGMSGVIGSAMVGAGLGAATAYATGGDPLMGALGGGVSGGIAGFNAPVPGGMTGGSSVGGYYPSMAGGAMAPPIAQGAAGGLSTLATETSSLVDPTFSPPYQVEPSGSFTPSGGPSFVAETSCLVDPSQVGPGLDLSGGYAPYNGAYPNLIDANKINMGGGGTAANYNQPTLGDKFSGWVDNASNKISNFAGELPDKIMSSEALKQAGGKALTMGVSNAMAGDTPDMSAFEKAKMADLNAARAKQLELQNKKQSVSDSYVQQASNINPEYYGQQALTEEQNRLNRAQQAGLRNVNQRNQGQVNSQTRKNALDKSRLSGFDRGRQEAEAKRLQYMQAAQGSAPTGAQYAGSIAKDLAAEDARYKRLADAGQEASDVFQPIADEIFSTTKKKKLEEATP